MGTLHPDSLVGEVLEGHNPDPDFRPASPYPDTAEAVETNERSTELAGLRVYAVTTTTTTVDSTTTTTTTTYYVPLNAPAYLFSLPNPNDAHAGH